MKGRLLGAILLVTGTTIGAGMLALPVITGMAGFIPSTLLLLGYWLFMLFTAFLILEATLWFSKEVNLISMAQTTMGSFGSLVTWVVYLFLLYALTTAYLAGCSTLFLEGIYELSGLQLPEWVGALPLVGLFGFFIYKGVAHVDQMNRWMMGGMLVAFIALITFLLPEVKLEKLTHRDWALLPLSFSIVATSFGFHIIIPSLVQYLERDVESLKKALWIGSLIPLITYLIWECLTLGILDIAGGLGIHQAYVEGINGGELLADVIRQPKLAAIVRIFSFFLIVTSFLGVSLSLFDFLADGFKIRKDTMGKTSLFALTFAPPLAISLHNPRAFLDALEAAGAYGVVVLLGLIPALIVWRGRTLFKGAAFKSWGGKGALMCAILLSLGIIIHELLYTFYYDTI